MALPYLPPKYGLYLRTGLKYWALLGTLLDDLAILVLCIGLCVAYADFRAPA